MTYLAAEAKESLKGIFWEDGAVLPISEGPYRFRVVVQCSPKGRQKAMFQNGEHSYFSYVQLLGGDGSWIKQGGAIVPVLPDGRLLMVVEQRPPQGQYDDNVSTVRIAGKNVDLLQFGPYSSLEFPGGAIDLGEGYKSGILRELVEETGVGEQSATYCARCHPVYPQGADLALRQYLGVVYLSGVAFPDHTDTDGGLAVLALSKEDVIYNIRSGAIRSVQAALTPWTFYQEVEEATLTQGLLEELSSQGYLTVEALKLALPK